MNSEDNTPVKGDILIVEDDLQSLQTLSNMLSREGYDVRGVSNGPMALTVVENNTPELILLDVRIPGMNGFEVCRRIKFNERSSDIPILFLSALDEATDKIKSFKAGAVDYITKPFQTEEVLARVDTHITVSRLKRKLQHQIEERTAELKKSEEQLRMMKYTVDHAMDRIAWIGPDGRFLYANIAGYNEMNFSLEQVLSMRVSDIDPNYPQEKWEEHFRELKKEGERRLETKQIDGEGQTHYIDVYSKYIKFDETEFICGFGRDITELKMVQETLAKQLEFELLIADIASRLSQVGPEQLDESIDITLRSLGRFLKSERAYFAKFSEDGKSLKFTNIWADEGIEVPSSLYELDIAADIPWVARQIRSGEVINVRTGLIGLPDEAEKLRTWFEKNGVNSGVAVPVLVEGRAIGMLGLENIIFPQQYSQSIVDRFRIVADMIGSSLHRVFAQKQMMQYLHIVESTTSAVSLVDRNYVYQYVNNAYTDAFQKDRQEMIGRTVADLLGQEMFDRMLKPHYDRCFTGEEVTFQSWFDLPGWGHRFMDVLYSPYFDFYRKVVAVVVSAHDITEVKQLEMKWSESEARFRAFMDNNPDSIYIKDENDRHIYGNPAAFKSVKMKPNEFIGSTTRDLWPPPTADKLIELDRKVLAGDTPSITEEWRNAKEGDTRWIRDIKFPIKLESGEKLVGGIAIDISEIKHREQELRNAYIEIKRLKEKIEQENIYLREEIELEHRHTEIIGNSEATLQMLKQAEQVADSDSTVLIQGETGTGKELLARAIHRMSPRSRRTMIVVNCAALPASLIESEMFGREKGAFTGALSGRTGRFEIADGSTIFLDEIGELKPDMQMKLLRVLETGTFERLGSNKTTKVDVRIIAATNRDLVKAVQEGSFRPDLYYRLNVFPIRIPNLRDRIEDMEQLVWAFVKEYGVRMGKRVESIPRKSIEALKRYPWAGNIRELRNVIEQSMIITKGTTLNVQLPGTQEQIENQRVRLEDVERNHIQKILEQTGWRVRGKAGAAELLGLKPTTLDARMKKLEIVRPR
jgi:PAS domain S-box-containing protein